MRTLLHRSVADRLVQLTLDALEVTPLTIWDPSCGGGAFLLAAAREIEARTSTPRTVIVEGCYASDIDSTALDVCDATLELWSGSEARPTVHCGDALLDLPRNWVERVDLIVGNPPFLGQLTSDTARGAQRREALATAYKNVATGYVDDAGLFLELAIRRRSERGAVGLILPESLLGARDAAGVRSSAQESAFLHTLWVDEGQSFEAAVDVVGVILASRSGRSRESSVVVGMEHPPLDPVGEPNQQSWAPLLADALGVPRVSLNGSTTLGEIAVVTAGFRQHFYGIAEAVRDGAPTERTPRLMTSGTIDPLVSRWGDIPVRFSGVRWANPVLELDRIEDVAVRSWFEARCVPKVLLASQTRVVEAVVDTSGTMVPSVPVVSVEPKRAEDVWRIAALLSCPAVTAWLLREAAGTGLSHDAVRVRAKTLSTLPLPTNNVAWGRAAVHSEAAQQASDVGDHHQYVESLRDLAKAMGAAYGVEDPIGSWWWERIRTPEGFEDTPY